MTLGQLSAFGANFNAIWEFAVGVLRVSFTAGLVLMGITLIRELIR